MKDTTMDNSSRPTGAAIAFLHSSAAPIEQLNRLGRDLAPGVKLIHVVREDLLCAVNAAGGIDFAVEMKTREALQALADNGAQIIVCTCAVLGAIVEQGAAELREDVGVPVFSPRIGYEAALRLAAA